MVPSDHAASPPDVGERPEPDMLAEAAADLRVSLTTILGRSQLLQRRIRSGQVSNIYACMDTLGQIDVVVRRMTERLHRLEQEQT